MNSDNIHELLSPNGLIDDKSVRDFPIRKKFKLSRASNVTAGDAVGAIREHYPYLKSDTINEILYQINLDIAGVIK